MLLSDDLLCDWCCALEFIVDQDIADGYLEKIVNKWFVIRGFSFSNSMMEMYKQESKKGTDHYVLNCILIILCHNIHYRTVHI